MMVSAIRFDTIEQPKDADCSVCRNSFESPAWMSHDAHLNMTGEKVQHIFHRQCLFDWTKQMVRTGGPNAATCPLCREVIDIQSFATAEEPEPFSAALIERKNIQGIAEEKLLNKSLFTASGFTTCLTTLFLMMFDVACENGYPIAGLAITSAIFCGTAFLGWWRMRPLHHTGLSIAGPINCAFWAGVTASLHLIDPLANRSYATNAPFIAFPYGAFSIFASYFYLPAKYKFSPTQDNNYVSGMSADLSSPLIGLIGLAAWKYWSY